MRFGLLIYLLWLNRIRFVYPISCVFRTVSFIKFSFEDKTFNLLTKESCDGKVHEKIVLALNWFRLILIEKLTRKVNYLLRLFFIENLKSRNFTL